MALAAGLMLFLVGDRAAATAIPGIDPLDVLDLAVKNNVLFIVDTSGSMTGTVKRNHDQEPGGDDPAGRFYQAKRALREVVRESEGIANFGLGTFHQTYEDREIRAKVDMTTPATRPYQTTSEGPINYISQDAAAATWMPYFNGLNGLLTTTTAMGVTNYDEWTSADMFRSLGFIPGTSTYERHARHGFDQAYPTGCINNPTPGGDHIMETHCRYYMRSMLLRSDVQFTWNPSASPRSGGLVPGSIHTPTTVPAFTCPLPPKGLLGDDVDGFNDGTKKRACFQIVNSATGATATYFMTSTAFTFEDKDGVGGSDECLQTGINIHVPPCLDMTAVTNIEELMRLELQYDPATGRPLDVPFAQYPTTATATLDRLNPKDNLATAPTSFYTNPRRTGIRSAGGTPIAASLRWAKNYFQTTVWPARPAAVLGKQKNFVIVLTDGAESCETVPDAVAAAQDLYNLAPSADNRVETLVIVFAESVSSANQIARGGSGNLRDAYTALDLESLIEALKDAISLASFTGTYGAQTSMTASIYELGTFLTPAIDPMDPVARYTANVPVLVSSSFDMPGFKGHLKAFRNASGSSLEIWDAGQKLVDRVQTGMSACPSRTVNSVSYNACTFSELHNDATEANVGSTAKIKRRIYTTSRNNLSAVTAANLIDRTANQGVRVALWPPNTSTSGVAPADNANSSGTLDTAMGLASFTEQELKSKFQACVGSNLPADCTSTTAATRLQIHRRETREMMLAFLAGAQTIPDANGNPARVASGGSAKQLLYKARAWILAESTLSGPAAVTPPQQSKPNIHINEYELFRDGPRDSSNHATNGTLQGFGLRNPDDDDQAASKSNASLKPAMSVVYHGANDGLHAYRGAPCPSASLPCAGETGGEELWAFVPFDQLGKLPRFMKTQRRSDKTYMIAASVRFADVWVPGPFTMSIAGASVAGEGVWRTFLYVGRGIAGKYLTAIDVTVPGPFTRHSINGTDPFAPIPVWSRGNPDTSDGQLKGLLNSYNNPSAGMADYNAYSKMGQTWSVPGIATVTPAENTTARTPAGVEFVAYVGSGYGATGEGTTFYALDALTGDVIASTDVDLATSPPASPIFTPNALVASPAVFTPRQFRAGFIGNPASEKATRVYIGDVYGRLWKFVPSTANTGFPAVLMQDLGVQQPIGEGVALLTLDYDGIEKPYIFLETGRDNRVAPPPAATPAFKLIGLRDDAVDGDATTPQNPYELFNRSDPGTPGIDLPARFRGTLQPATAFNAEGFGRVFFVGTQYNPIDASCISSFDSILFALTAGTGVAAYDMGNSGTPTAYTTFIGQKFTGLDVINGQLVMDKGIAAGTPPPPPAPPTVLPAPPGSEGDVFMGSALPASTAFRLGSVVCQ